MKKSTRTAVAASVVVALVASGAYRALAAEPYAGSRFADVWAEARSTPYGTLPQASVSVGRFFSWGVNKLQESAVRTLSDRSDVLPRFDKLVHPNGICLAGTWSATEDSPYTGYFAKGSRAVILSRASVALSDTKRGSYRGFGLTGKLYPTDDPAHAAPLETANFFLVDDLGGTKTDHYTDAAMTNEPATTVRFDTALSLAPIAAATTAAFRAADINPGRRQVYPIAALGLADPSALKAPKYMKVQGAPGIRVDADDFRDELDVRQYGGHLEFDVFVSEDKQAWSKIGVIDYTDSVASDSCDHRIHFSHPKFRSDLP